MDISNLTKPFSPAAISWRVGSTNKEKTRGMALAYIDARDVQDRLNQVCGPFGWQCRHEVSGDKRITCHIGIQNPETKEWVWKSDGAGETDFEGEKGSYSDSFKRAAVKWGIGRYLYDVDASWVEIEQAGRSYAIKPSEKAKLAAILGGAKSEPVRQPAANETTPSAPGASEAFLDLKSASDAITGQTTLAQWAKTVQGAVDRKQISTSEHAQLQAIYRNINAKISPRRSNAA